MTPRDVSDIQDAIKTQNEDKIMELVKKVQDLARDNLNDDYKKFCDSLMTPSSQKESWCSIQ